MNADLGNSRASPAGPLRHQRSRIPLAVSRLRNSTTKTTSEAERQNENSFYSGRETGQHEEHLEDGYDSDTRGSAEISSQIEDEEESKVDAYPESSPEKYEDQDEDGSGLHAYPKTSPGKLEDEEDEDVDEDEEDTSLQPSSLCQYTSQCNTGSQDYRKVISHIFGRNKKCTTQIPDSCWIIYCRKHYQRTRYRTSKAQVKNYFRIQFDNLARQLTRMEKWGGVRSWNIGLRKKEREILSAEDSALAQLQATGASIDNETVARVHRCRERYLLPYIGDNKTFDDVRRFTRAIEREVERSGATELPGFELLPDIDLEEHPAGGARNNIKFETTRSSAGPSRKQKKQLSSTSRGQSTPKAPNRRRLVRGTPLLEDDEDGMMLEDVKMEPPAETAKISESASTKDLSIKDQQRAKPANKKGDKSRTTEDILEQGWFPKEERLKPPPSRSTTPKSSTSKPDSLRKEAGNRSASKQKYPHPHTSERLGSPSVHVRPSKTRKEQSADSDASGSSFQGYDPWPNSTPEKAKAQSVESRTPVFDSNIQNTGESMKKGTKRSADPETPTPSASLVDLNDTKRARISYSEPSRKTSSRYATPSSPNKAAYRPATPATPTRGTGLFDGSPYSLPEMRKFRTPRAPRSVTLSNRTLSIERTSTPTPQVSRARAPHANTGHAPQLPQSMAPQPLLSSPSPLRRHVSPSPLSFMPVNKDDEEINDVAS